MSRALMRPSGFGVTLLAQGDDPGGMVQDAGSGRSAKGAGSHERGGGFSELADRQVRFFFRHFSWVLARNRWLTAVMIQCRRSER